MKKRGKKAQQVFGMGFSVIFGIILAVAIIALAVYVIVWALNSGQCYDTGLFLGDFEKTVRELWNSQQGKKVFESSLPTKIKFVCFANLSEAVSPGASQEEKTMFNDLSRYEVYKASMFLYHTEKACDMEFKKISYIIFDKNPVCFKNVNGKVEIPLEKGFNSEFVKIR